jgi:hypothetical protein
MKMMMVKSLILAGSMVLILSGGTSSVRANVYATNVRLNGSTSDVTITGGSNLQISYILNEPASAGVSIQILSGSTPIRTMTISAGTAGALRGLNTVIWDGKADGGATAPAGTYSVSITAGSTGYAGWTQTTDDNNVGNYVYETHGIAVNRNSKSPYFGRVFVASSFDNTSGGSLPGDAVGILKVNADGSAPADGLFSTGGYAWPGNVYSPWKIEVSEDDYVYINDWNDAGIILRWDQTLSESSTLPVLRTDNWSPGVNMSGPAIYGTGAATEVWMADITVGGRGIIRFKVTPDGTLATNDVGLTVVGVDSTPGNTNLSLYPYDVALDAAGNIYTVQYRANASDPSSRVLRFPAYDPSTNSDQPVITADWAIGNSDPNFCRATGLAIDATGTFLAVAFRGVTSTNSSTMIFHASDGTLVANVDAGARPKQDDCDCAWDAVGNLYVADNYNSVWRAFSPPGANQATTLALPKVTLGQAAEIRISGISPSGNNFVITFTAAAGSDPASFKLTSASDVGGTYIETSATATLVTTGVYQFTVAASGPSQFYRIKQ